MRLAQVAGTKLSPFLGACHAPSTNAHRLLLTHVARGRKAVAKDAAFCFILAKGSESGWVFSVLGLETQAKNYYRPNKRYFSRDECALVRVLFYFVELQSTI